jgi:hypothetical protein
MDGTEDALTSSAMTGVYGKRGLRSWEPNNSELQSVVIRLPNRIFEGRKAGANSRKRNRPFAFVAPWVPLSNRRGEVAHSSRTEQRQEMYFEVL